MSNSKKTDLRKIVSIMKHLYSNMFNIISMDQLFQCMFIGKKPLL